MVENGFVYAVNKFADKLQKQEDKRQIKTNKLYNILHKYNKTLDTITKDELTKTEHKFITEYIENELKYPLKWYENL